MGSRIVPVDLEPVYGVWTVMGLLLVNDAYPLPFAICRCHCGNERTIFIPYLRNGTITQCGNCQRSTHGGTRKNANRRTYKAWIQIKERCCNVRHFLYPKFGGRGIKVCAEWVHDFARFRDDMGERPDNATLTLLDPDGDYEPNNCAWKVRHHRIKPLADQAGISITAMRYRIRSGWPMERALTEPKRHSPPRQDKTKPVHTDDLTPENEAIPHENH